MSAMENSQLDSLAATTARLLEVRAERAQLDADYNRAVLDSDKLVAALKQRIAQLTAGFHVDKLALALQVLDIRGEYEPGIGEHDAVVADAIKWFATGERATQFSSLGEGMYYGVKNYAHWYGQRSDHPLGSCPRHGGLVFRIGLRDHTKAITPDEAEACLYYLNNLAAIQKNEATD